MSDLSLTMKETDRLKVMAMLAGVRDGAPKVLSRSINKTLNGVKTDSDKEIRSVITMKKSDVVKSFSIPKKSTVKNLSAKFVCSDRPRSLIMFSNTQRKKGISVKVLKSGSRTVLKHAFYTNIKNEKAEAGSVKWISERQAKWYGAGSGRKMQPSFAASLPDKYRFPLKRLTGPRIADIMGKPTVLKKIQNQADERLHKNINQQLNYELSKL